MEDRLAGAGLDAAIFDFDVRSIDGREHSMRDYAGRVLLIVNVASRCGFTPQYRGLEQLYRNHRGEGFLVLGFPCNQFGGQEPGTAAEIQAFCSTEYDVTFPLFEKVEVNGQNAHPLFRFLTARAPGWLGIERITWNFTKFLVGRDGAVIGRFGSRRTPASIEQEVVKALRS